MSRDDSVDPLDAVVVGAGPAGSAAAITLGRLGRKAVLIDKAAFPRDKCCGDGLTTAALRLLEDLGLDPADVASWQPSASVTVVSSAGRTVELDMPDDGTAFAASACRSDLDAALVNLAEKAGVRVLQECGLSSIAAGPGGCVSVTTIDGQVLHTRYVVAADGMWSPTRKYLGLSEAGYLGDWQAGRQYFSDVGPEAGKIWVWFEPDMVPGYAWSFPLAGGRANVGYGVIRKRGSGKLHGGLRGQYIELPDRPEIAKVLGPAARPSSPWRAWPIPTGISGHSLSALGGRVLFAGDAARAADPMTGEGIAQALETGAMAARSLHAAGPRGPGLAARRYGRLVRSGMAVDQRLSALLTGVLARPSGSDRSVDLLERHDRFRRGFARWMFEDYPRAALITPHRWRWRLMSRPGAFGGSGMTRR